MGIEYYAFALFIAVLISLLALLFKLLFSDTKRQQKLLDEKESKILQLYVSVETLTEEFNDLARVTIEEMKEYESRAISRKVSASELSAEFEKIEKVLERMPKSAPLDVSKVQLEPQQVTTAQVAPIPALSHVAQQAYSSPATLQTVAAPSQLAPQKVEAGGAVFQKMFEDIAESEPALPTRGEENVVKPVKTRSDIILAMSNEGKDDIQIASELGITRNEVTLVLGLKTR